MVIRRLAGAAAALACLFAVSCRSIFDSYVPEAVEYLETQSNLAATLGGGGIASVKLGYLPATALHATDYLVVIAYTNDGAAHVLFCDPGTLSVTRNVSDAELKATNGGVLPALQLVAQDSTSLHTGWVSYDASLTPRAGIASNLATTLGSGGLTSLRAGFDGVNVVVIGQMGGLGLSSGPAFLGLSGMVRLSPALGTGSYINPVDFTAAGGYYYLLADEGSTVYLVKAAVTAGASAITAPTNVVPIQPASLDTGNQGGWVTATAAIVQDRIDKTYTLRAYSWAGKELGSLAVPHEGSQNLAIVFEPSGKAWYLYDPSTGRLSRHKVWW